MILAIQDLCAAAAMRDSCRMVLTHLLHNNVISCGGMVASTLKWGPGKEGLVSAMPSLSAIQKQMGRLYGRCFLGMRSLCAHCERRAAVRPLLLSQPMAS